MRGHIRRRGERSWAVVVDLAPDPATGKRRQKWHSVKGTKRDAERELARLLNELNTGGYVEPTRMTIGQYMKDWLAQTASTVRPLTHESYAAMARCHIEPALGAVRLNQLSPAVIERWCREQLAGGRADGRGQALSPRTVRYCLRILSMALKRAVRLGLVPRNAAEAVDPPRHSRREVPFLDVRVAERLIQAAGGTRLELPVLLAVTTGMRRGEILGLRWADVDLARGSLEVRQALLPGRRFAPPKTTSGRRPVALPQGVAEPLKKQRASCEEARRLLGPAYEDHDLVVCLGDGRPWEPTTLSSAFHELARRTGLGGLRFHDLRHLHATVLLRAGIHPKVVADRLGHSTVGVTLDTYSHVVPDLQRQAAQAIDTLLGGQPPSGR